MASTNASNELNANTTPSTSKLLRHGLVALIVASILNIVILYASLAVINFPQEFVGGTFGPLAIGPVVVNSVIAAVGATLVYGVIARYSTQPNRMFVIIAGAMLLLSFAMFLAPDIAGAPLEVLAVLAVMHVAAAIAIVGVLTRVTTVEVPAR